MVHANPASGQRRATSDQRTAATQSHQQEQEQEQVRLQAAGGRARSATVSKYSLAFAEAGGAG